jgi:hypothetical protein
MGLVDDVILDCFAFGTKSESCATFDQGERRNLIKTRSFSTWFLNTTALHLPSDSIKTIAATYATFL